MLAGLVCVLLLTSLFTAPLALSQADDAAAVPVAVEIVEEDGGFFESVGDVLTDFQRRANAEVAFHMNAIERGENLGAFLLALAVAFAYGAVHALGPGHGKFVVVSYFLGREARVVRGVVMAIQIAIVHVIAAVVIVWLADLVLRGGFGLGLSDVPGVRAASFLIIVGIGLYMLYRAVRASLGRRPHGHDHGHGHHDHGNHHHHHDHGHRHRDHSHGSKAEGGILALAAGMVPCPGAVLIMLYAVANDMIVPGSLLVAAMSLGIGSSICVLGVSAILARQAAMRVMERSGGGRATTFRHGMNYAGAALVTLVGLVSFIAFLDTPLG
ncbi:MAG: hypothetical protein OXI57_10590 [Rhodospirillales bacterium]|nr:hypothetical protein [Rhodospirillales bacterium]